MSSVLLVVCVVIVTGIQLYHADLQKAADDAGVFDVKINQQDLPGEVADLGSYINLDLDENGQLSTLECISAIAKIVAIALCAKFLFTRMVAVASKNLKKFLKSKKLKGTNFKLLAACVIVLVITQFQSLWVPLQLQNIHVSRCVFVQYCMHCLLYEPRMIYASTCDIVREALVFVPDSAWVWLDTDIDQYFSIVEAVSVMAALGGLILLSSLTMQFLVEPILRGSTVSPDTLARQQSFHISRAIFIRAMGLIYLAAFASNYVQWPGA